MNPKDNGTLVRRLFDEVYAGNNINALEQFIAKDVRLHDPAAPEMKQGLDQLKRQETLYKKAFPSKQLNIDEMIVSDNNVVVRWTCRAKHEGPYNGHSASGKKVQITGITIYKIKDGKITDIQQVWDQHALLEQIGATTPMRLAA